MIAPITSSATRSIAWAVAARTQGAGGSRPARRASRSGRAVMPADTAVAATRDGPPGSSGERTGEPSGGQQAGSEHR